MIHFYDGNKAVVEGSLRAGCNFFSGYPITPATQILSETLKKIYLNDGVAIQAEDEIAAIGMCIGASMTGAKVMTATSGPGISLYSENIGLAIMAEVPLVIIDCQRLGPATGSATKDSAGDIQFIRWSTSGGYPIIALCPNTVAETYKLTIEAFNLAEKFRTPVFLLLSKELSQTSERFEVDMDEDIKLVSRKYYEGDSDYQPYKINKPEDIPEFYPFDGKIKNRFTTSSHSTDGNFTSDIKTIENKLEHLNKKIVGEDIELIEYTPIHDAEIIIISYGIVSRSVLEAQLELGELNEKVSSLRIISIWPVPTKKINKIIEKYKTIIVVEMNNGQYFEEIKKCNIHGKNIKLLSKVNGELISPEEVIQKVCVNGQ